MGKDRAACTAGSAHGPWRMADSPGLHPAPPNVYFDSLGIPGLTIDGKLNPPSRRMRTRMSGGVGGEEPPDFPLSRFHPAPEYDRGSRVELSTIHPNRNVTALGGLVHRANRRTASHAAAAILFAGAAAALAVFVLVLIAGTGILHWGWSAAAGLTGAAGAAWRGRKRLPSSYQTAQRIDRSEERRGGKEC